MKPAVAPGDYLDCLVATASFETLWAYYWQSDGILFDEECRLCAGQIADAVAKVREHDASILEVRPESPPETRALDLPAVLQSLANWSKSEARFPVLAGEQSDGAAGDHVFVSVWGLTSVILGNSIQAMGGSKYGMSMLSARQPEYTAGYLRWKAHLPDRILRKVTTHNLLEQMSNAPSIAVIGDTKRSQDLMTYARDSQQFSDRISTFTERIREISDACGGMFDKFTGDGFLVYFNDVLTEKVGLTRTEAFLKFVRTVSEFAGPYFEDWARSVRKQPGQPVGLALGADIGRIDFQDRRNHLIAVGDAIVWASRMASAAGKGNIAVNNLLASELRPQVDVRLEPFAGETKTGEDFLAYRLGCGEIWALSI
jgi:class 3 adenylate cyclase